MRKLLNRKNGKSGFTLIEIIAVLVIIGILAAVAVPKFMSLIDDAKRKALNGAIATGLSQCSLSYGKLSLQLGTAPTAAQILADVTAYPPSSDLPLSFALGGGGVDVTAQDPSTTPVMSTNKVWILP